MELRLPARPPRTPVGLRSRLVPTCDEALWHARTGVRDFMPFWSVTAGKLLRQLDEFEVVHSHLDYFGFPLARQAPVPVLTTLHGRLDLPELQFVFREFADVPLKIAARMPLLFRDDPMVMPEALACGTPVLALRCGSVSEVIRDGLTGFVRDTEQELVEALAHLNEIDRAECRREAERRFSPAAMADAYERVYEQLARPQSRVVEFARVAPAQSGRERSDRAIRRAGHARPRRAVDAITRAARALRLGRAREADPS